MVSSYSNDGLFIDQKLANKEASLYKMVVIVVVVEQDGSTDSL